jgi:hypothetical protein
MRSIARNRNFSINLKRTGMRIKIYKYLIPLVIAVSCSLSHAQSGLLIDISQGSRLIPSGHGEYFGALRLGFSTVLDTRTNMNYSWREYLDFPVIGIYSANPGLPVSLGATFHQFLFAFLPVGLPLFKSLAVYTFLEPAGYMFRLINFENDAIGASWFSTCGLEIGTGGVFLSIAVQYFYQHNIWIPQAGLKVYLY